ncbi:MAG: MoxR family ATPase [Chthoniobacteraceae bacterium]
MSHEPASRLTQARQRLDIELAKIVVGQKDTLELLLVALLCEGHVLLLGMPGVGKTLMAATLARVLDLEFHRIQFTPDLMPGDITGSDYIEEDPATGRQVRSFVPGPIFANFLLADEINRTAPKTQSALLQAMQEREVTAGRQTFKLKRPFLVVATQNPIEHEGTYPLPEAQLDRFMFCVRVGYPDARQEAEIARTTTAAEPAAPQCVLSVAEILEFQKLVRTVPIADDVVNYAVRLGAATRPDGGSAPVSPLVTQFVTFGVSPRASQYLVLGAKAHALLHGRLSVDFADIRALVPPVFRHRLVLNYRARAEKITTDHIAAEIVAKVPEEMRG